MTDRDTAPDVDVSIHSKLDTITDVGREIIAGMVLRDIKEQRPRTQAYSHDDIHVALEMEPLLRMLQIRQEWQSYRGEQSLTCWSDRAIARIRLHGAPGRLMACIRAWADTYPEADSMRDWFIDQLKSHRIDSVAEPAFCLNWRFVSADNSLGKSSTVEKADDVLLDEAYPGLGGIEAFIRDYLDSPEPVLVLQGPPGTGKTRLIRAILAEIARRKGDVPGVLYTGDQSVLERDEVFIEFIGGDHDAFMIEDADALLLPRTEGNQLLHRFLNVSDGIVRAQKRKIIFSTNLPATQEIDSALLRPGRCFEHVYFAGLTRDQAFALGRRLCDGAGPECQRLEQLLTDSDMTTHSVADVYAAHRRASMLDPDHKSRRVMAPKRVVGFVA